MDPPDAAVRAKVEGAGWSLVDPGPISAGMAPYRDFIVGSRGEFTVAKDIYVRPNSGWFSDRSVCYLAAGRPVVTMRPASANSIRSGAACSSIRARTRRSPRIDAIAADYRGTAARRGNWPTSILPPSGSLTR